MKWLDRELQRQRVKKCLKYLPTGSQVLDVGCADGRLFVLGKQKISGGLGLDVDCSLPWRATGIKRIIGEYPNDLTPGIKFDIITMLAVLEHLSDETIRTWARESFKLLREGGRVIITMPSPSVDKILHVGIRLRLLDGMDAEAHHGCSPANVELPFIEEGFDLQEKNHFQFGLNNLFVFEKPVMKP